jgi:hypothetical protein
MKKILTLALATLMLLAVLVSAISCDSTETDATSSAETTLAPTETTAGTPDSTIAPDASEATEPEETEPEETEPEGEENIIHIKTPDDLLELNQSIIYNRDYDGYTISIDNDIDMAGTEWPSMNGYFLYNTVFEGNGHTISNLNIVPHASNPTRVGFVSLMDGGAIAFRNLTFKNCTTTAGDSNGVAIVLGCALKSDVEITNVHVLDSNIITATKYKTGASDNEIGIRIAAMVGYSHENSEIVIRNSSVKRFVAEGFHNLACFVGYDSAWLTSLINCSAEDVRLNFAYCYANGYNLEQNDKYIQVFYGGGNWEDTLDSSLANGNTYKNVIFFDMDSQTEIDPVNFRTKK